MQQDKLDMFFPLLKQTCLLCFVSVFVSFTINEHGNRWGSTAQTLAFWRHQVASSVCMDMLHWEMHTALYHRITMAIKTVDDSPAFFDTIDFLVTHNCK
jgi:hypothetical protein